jgi:hypothetical protein
MARDDLFFQGLLNRIVRDLKPERPCAVLLFGSTARFLLEPNAVSQPRDIDLLVIGDQIPVTFETADYGFPTEIRRMRTFVLTEIARSLRYDSRPVALAKLYGKQMVQQAADGVVAACLLLGPDYRSFGIQQIEIEGREDPRDYSVHQVLDGHRWWRQVAAYARKRRGPLRRYSDRIAGREMFDAR